MTTLDLGDGTSNLSGYESRTTSWRLVVEKDTVTGEHAVCFTVVDDDPVGILLGNTIRRSRIERSYLSLRDLTYLTVKLRGGGLVELGEVDQAARADSIQQTKGTNTIGFGSVLRHLERHSDVRHSSKIVDLMRLDFTHDVEKVGRVAKITIVKEKLQSSLYERICAQIVL